jgi:outer membrane protein assembly factor BamD (BamD/ComL family)
MKKAFLFFSFFILFFIFAENSFAQRNIDPQIDRDPILEADAKHNLEVAWQYFKLKKAYKAVLDRCEETIAAHPAFSKMDEVLYLSGMSSYYLSQNKGKQKVNLKTEKDKERFAPEKLKENAEAYLATLVEKYPDSKYKNEAEEALKILKNDK